MSVINQKEYLKKYLGLGKQPGEKKKKKKKDKVKTSSTQRLKIIDDDIDVALSNEIQEDLSAIDNEDAPQIVSIIDERPHSMQIDELTNSKLWQPIGGRNSEQTPDESFKKPKTTTPELESKSKKKSGDEKKEKKHKSSSKYYESYSPVRKQILSPPRKSRNFSPDFSPKRTIKKEKIDVEQDEENLTPERDFSHRKRQYDLSPVRKHGRNGSPPNENLQISRKKYEDFSPPRKQHRNLSPPSHKSDEKDLTPPRKHRNLSPPLQHTRKGKGLSPKSTSEDLTPPRRYSNKSEDDLSPGRNQHRNLSPPRRSRDDDTSPQRKHRNLSPPRKHGSRKYEESEDLSPPRKHRNSSPLRSKNLSPHRKQRNMSPPGKHSRKHEDLSPQRKHHRNASPPGKHSRKDKDLSPYKHRNLSPPVKYKKGNEDFSPQRKHRNLTPPRRTGNESSQITTTPDLSPPRKDKRGNYDDLSPVRRHIKKEESLTPPRHHKYKNNTPPKNKHDDLSPVRRQIKKEKGASRDFTPPLASSSKKYKDEWSSKSHKKREDKPKQSRWETTTSPPEGSKSHKTLSGKKAGLQNAKELAEEIQLMRRKEEEMFNNLSEEQSGRNAATIVRSKNKKKEAKDLEEEARKLEREKEMKEKYDKWGKGLKQVQDQNEKLAEQMHEMSKPLARYADDEDLEKYLKEQEREGDPMLAYIRSKKRKKAAEAGISEKPIYTSEFMPNRFGIRPGYRWDGVDRSNGYEKRWIQTQNAKKASQEDAFKWSTEDM